MKIAILTYIIKELSFSISSRDSEGDLDGLDDRFDLFEIDDQFLIIKNKNKNRKLVIINN